MLNLILRLLCSVFRTRLRWRDRAFWDLLSCIWGDWQKALYIVQPETVIRWHRQGFRYYWRWKSRVRWPGRPKTPKEIRDLIRQMSRDNPLWGTPRIHGELLKLGIEQVLISPHSPWQTRNVERVIGSIRRECLDHVIIFDERYLRRALRK